MKKLFVIGTGPGDLNLLTPKAKQAIEASTDLVAYGLYVDLLGDICAGKKRHDLVLGEEIKRARVALDLAAQGKDTALISSGDIGIYARLYCPEVFFVLVAVDADLGLLQHHQFVNNTENGRSCLSQTRRCQRGCSDNGFCRAQESCAEHITSADDRQLIHALFRSLLADKKLADECFARNATATQLLRR